MFFERIDQAIELATKSGFTIFAIENQESFLSKLPKESVYQLSPELSQKQGKITVEDIRTLISQTNTKQTSPFYIIITAAEKMNEQAQNALLKLLEEPRPNYHFVLITKTPSTLLPTVLSRANVYLERTKNTLSSPVTVSDEIKTYAKQIISAKTEDLSSIYEQITKTKNFKKDSRSYLINIIEAAIEILYKSYFSTGKIIFLKKIPKLLFLLDNLKQNGHLKLHFVADLC